MSELTCEEMEKLQYEQMSSFLECAKGSAGTIHGTGGLTRPFKAFAQAELHAFA